MCKVKVAHKKIIHLTYSNDKFDQRLTNNLTIQNKIT